MTFPATQPLGGSALTPDLMRNLLLRTAEMPGADYRVLNYYVLGAPLGQPVRETAKKVAEELKLSTTSMSRSLQRLRTGGWLEVAYRVAGVNFYKVGPEVTGAPAKAVPDQPLATVRHLPMALRHEDE